MRRPSRWHSRANGFLGRLNKSSRQGWWYPRVAPSRAGERDDRAVLPGFAMVHARPRGTACTSGLPGRLEKDRRYCPGGQLGTTGRYPAPPIERRSDTPLHVACWSIPASMSGVENRGMPTVGVAPTGVTRANGFTVRPSPTTGLHRRVSRSVLSEFTRIRTKATAHTHRDV